MMIGLGRLWALCVIAFTLGGCKAAVPTACKDADKACQHKAFKSHPVKSVAAWRAQLEDPLSQRVGRASVSLIEYLTLDNQLNGFIDRPTIPDMDTEFLADFRAAFDELPPEVLAAIGKRLVGIRFVANLGSSGYADYVYDPDGQVAGAFIVFDSNVLKSMTANQWATWKENSPFKPASGYALEAVIQTPAMDNRKNALQYILLHELAHVISVGRNIHPNWNESVKKQVASDQKFPFFETTWRFDKVNGTVVSKYDSDFPQRKNVVYYGVARIPGSEMAPTYARLEQTSFSTLYAATRPGDDFAEAFTNYVHVVKLQRPWQIVLLKEGNAIKTVTPCWEELRCAEKRKMIEDLLRR